MMKKILLIISCILVVSCNSESGSDCFKSAGNTITEDITTANFDKINVYEGIELIIKQAEVTTVKLTTGSNLSNDIEIKVEEGVLKLKNNATCNWVRDYNLTKVYVTVPNLTTIYSASQFTVKSDGILNFPMLTLQSGVYKDETSGIIDLEVNCENLYVESNFVNFFKIKGNTNYLSVNLYAGDARFDGSNLIAQNVEFFQRSSNDIIVNPQQRIKGNIYSTGNVILKNNPPIIDIVEHYKGYLVLNQ
ncbi:head GIN domain-containing protein [Flavobacterium sp. '19STA2R22 D10 B1']|uniref:head GIN domain-containing protein n=1 Tax=Flavobacterium aerium TaxID=3037261 RepID=UPI00278BC6FC|nr:head GIN domain-containing protein [Flavobacterium sp. '19STA2R22 D10 B1']